MRTLIGMLLSESMGITQNNMRLLLKMVINLMCGGSMVDLLSSKVFKKSDLLYSAGTDWEVQLMRS